MLAEYLEPEGIGVAACHRGIRLCHLPSRDAVRSTKAPETGRAWGAGESVPGGTGDLTGRGDMEVIGLPGSR